MKNDIELIFKKELSSMYDTSIDKITILSYKYVSDSYYGNGAATYDVSKIGNVNDIIFNCYEVDFYIKKKWKKSIEGKTKIIVDSKDFKNHLRKIKIKKLNEH